MPARALAAAALLVAAGPLSGCGGDTKARSLRTDGPVAKAEAADYAHEVNLGPADVPGMVSVSLEKEEKAPRRIGVEIARCAGAPDPNRRVVAISSPNFRAPGTGLRVQQVSSQVEVRPAVEVAARDLAAVRSSRFRACAERLGQRQFTTWFARARVGHVAVLPMGDGLPANADSAGYRLVIPLSFRRGGVPIHTTLYADSFGFRSGPAEVVLTAICFSSPVPIATEQRLLSLLYRRATA
jgi:hypothetical protein